METKTKAQQLVEIAQWVKSQNPEFMKNFKSISSIIQVYKRLPSSYDKKKSLTAFIKKEKSSSLKLIINSLFGFRYFTDAPYRFTFRFGLRSYHLHSGKEVIEVRCTPVNNCSTFRTNLFERQEYGTHTITIKELSDAKRAAEKLLEDVKHYGDDYETIYGENLKEAMKKSKPSNDDLSIGVEVIV